MRAAFTAMSDANSFAIAASAVKGSPRSFSVAARHTKRRAASTSVAMSASIHWIAWSSAMGLPKAWRSFAYASESSRQARAMPTACAAIPIRPPSSVESAILKPWPTSPRRWSSSTRTFSKTSCAVSEPLMPSFCSTRPTVRPGEGLPTMNAVIPLCRDPGSVCANATITSADTPFVMKFFVPFSTQRPPSRFAVIWSPAASDPDAGSESAKHPSMSPRDIGRSHRSCCAAVPKCRIGLDASELWACMITPVDAQARLISSHARM